MPSRLLHCLILLTLCLPNLPSRAGEPAGSLQAVWKDLRSGIENTAPIASVCPLPLFDANPRFLEKLESGSADFEGCQVQGQVVSRDPAGNPTRMLLRWIQPATPTDAPEPDAAAQFEHKETGWSFSYRTIEGNTGERVWKMALKNMSLDETEYEMHQLDLKHPLGSVGIRLGLRTDSRIYWWQYVRADFIQRGPVFDVLRVGGPIYNEQSTLQSDLYLVLYRNGTVDAVAHFISHQREGEAIDVTGIPVLAFDVPGGVTTDLSLAGTESRFDLGDATLDLGDSVHYADTTRPGSLRTEGDVIVWQPWMDQQIYGGILVEREGIPDHRIIKKGGVSSEVGKKENLGEADRWHVTTIGDKTFPRGIARSVPFSMGLADAPPVVDRLEAPGWYHAQGGTLPTQGYLPTQWWAVPQALKAAENSYQAVDSNVGPFEFGRRNQDGDGTLGAALLALGRGFGRPEFCRSAIAPCYWWADIPVDHVTSQVRELAFFGWQWIVQPYSRFMDVVHGYRETGDPYLLETAEIAADGFYRFYVTNRPHRFVGRDALPVYCLLALYETTGSSIYLDRARRVLKDARDSYGQTDAYWPGHQSGAGTNGVARRENYDYTPVLLARLHVLLLEKGGMAINEQERKESWKYIKEMLRLARDRGAEESNKDWFVYRMALEYSVIAALLCEFPEESAEWTALLRADNERFAMPESHSGGRAYSWVSGAMALDAVAWGAEWVDGSLTLDPIPSLLDDPRAPKKAVISTPNGLVEAEWENGKAAVRQLDAQ